MGILRIVESGKAAIKNIFGVVDVDVDPIRLAHGWEELDPIDVKHACMDAGKRRLDIEALRKCVLANDANGANDVLEECGFGPKEGRMYAAIEIMCDTRGGHRIFVLEVEAEYEDEEEEDVSN